MSATHASHGQKKSHHLYLQVLTAILIGGTLGHFAPDFAVKMKPFGDGFIKLIKMIVGPIIFCTVVTGICSMDNAKHAGRVGVKALAYFFLMTLFSLAIGIVVANIAQPGAGMNVDPKTLDTKAVENYIGPNHQKLDTFADFALHIIPNNFVAAFSDGEILQVLFVALFFAAACAALGDRAKPVLKLVEDVSHIFFTIIGFIMKVAPLGAFGAMAFTVGKYGFASMMPLAKLMLCFYITAILFVFVVLGGIMRSSGFSIWRYIVYIKEELLIVLGTSSSETVFPRLVDKLTALGCDKSVVGMVLPTGYSFNLSGTMIYLTMAAIFLAQATNTPMSLGEQLALLGVMMLASKGAAGVVGSAFVVLASTLGAVGNVPVEAVVIVLGIDRFMSEGRALTNLIGYGVATIFVAKWEKKLDVNQARSILSGRKEARLETATD